MLSSESLSDAECCLETLKKFFKCRNTSGRQISYKGFTKLLFLNTVLHFTFFLVWFTVHNIFLIKHDVEKYIRIPALVLVVQMISFVNKTSYLTFLSSSSNNSKVKIWDLTFTQLLQHYSVPLLASSSMISYLNLPSF